MTYAHARLVFLSVYGQVFRNPYPLTQIFNEKHLRLTIQKYLQNKKQIYTRSDITQK